MAVKTEKIAVILEFLNEESKSLGRHVIEAQKLNKEIAALAVEEKKLANEAAKAAEKGKDVTAIEAKRVKIQEDLQQKLMQVLKAGKGIEGLDLNKVAPTQLLSIAKELGRMVGEGGFIPKGTAQYIEMSKALKKVNDQLATNRAETKGVAKGMQEAATMGTQLSKVFEIAYGTGLADLIENALGKIKEIGSALFSRSSELEGFSRKTNLVFGDATKDIEKFAERMSTEVGQSTADVIGDLNDISNSFTTLEFGKKDVAGLTKQLYELSAQWAQYNGGKYTALEVSEKFKVALGGEVDELSELGIVLTEDTMKKEMAKRGYDKLTGASFDQASALTLLQIITKKTTEAQASFGNNAETMAAKQNRVTSFLKNIWDDTAKHLIGVFSGVLKIGADIADSFKDTAPRMTQLANATEKEQKELAYLVEKTTLYSKGTKEREAAINALQAAYPDFLKNMNKETVTNEELRGKLQEVNKQYQAKRLLIETNKVVEEYMNKEKSATDDLAKKQSNYATQIARSRDIAKYYGDDIDVLKSKLKEASDAFQGAYKDNDAQLYLQFINRASKEQFEAESKLIDASQGKIRAKINEKKVNDELLKQHPELAAAFKEIQKALDEDTQAREKNYAAGVQFKKEIDPKELEKQAEAAFKLKLEAAKAAMELELVLNEKARLENKISEEKYQQEYHDIKKKWLEREAEIYKNSKHAKSLDAAKVQKDLVELEKNTAATLLKLKLEDVDRETQALKAVAENAFLVDTEGDKLNKIEFEKRHREFKIREIDIDQKAAESKLALLKAVHKEETTEYVNLQNAVLKLKQTRREIERTGTNQENKEAADARKRTIDEAVEAEETEFERKEGALRVKFVRLLVTEQDYELQRLQIKRDTIAKEIEILKEGDEHQRKRAVKLGQDLIATDADIEAQKLKNKERTAQLEFELQQHKLKMGHDALGIAIDLLGKDEASRKKHAKAIQAFEIGQIWVNTYAEISAIWKNNQKNPFYASIPGLAQGISIAESALSIGRAVAGTQKVTSTKFATGGFTSSLGLARDETGEEPAGVVHAGEWVAPKWMVRQYPNIFNQLDSVRLGEIMDGQRTLLPRFADGGSVAFNLKPRSDLVAPPQYAMKNYGVTDNSPDFYAMLKEMQMMRQGVEKWQKEFEVKMYYTKFTDKKNEIEADLVAGNL